MQNNSPSLTLQNPWDLHPKASLEVIAKRIFVIGVWGPGWTHCLHGPQFHVCEIKVCSTCQNRIKVLAYRFDGGARHIQNSSTREAEAGESLSSKPARDT